MSQHLLRWGGRRTGERSSFFLHARAIVAIADGTDTFAGVDAMVLDFWRWAFPRGGSRREFPDPPGEVRLKE